MTQKIKQFHCVEMSCGKRGSCAYADKIHPRQIPLRPNNVRPFHDCPHYQCKQHKYTHDNHPHCIYCGEAKPIHEPIRVPKHWTFA